MNKYQTVIETLQFAKGEIEKVLSDRDDEMHRMRISHRLQMEIDHLNLLHNVGITSEVKPMAGPATTIGGVPIDYARKITHADTTPGEDAVKTLKAHVDATYDSFLTTTNEVLLKEIDHMIIRGVAKKAGMNKVTKDKPETITSEFIDQIKVAIKDRE